VSTLETKDVRDGAFVYQRETTSAASIEREPGRARGPHARTAHVVVTPMFRSVTAVTAAQRRRGVS